MIVVGSAWERTPWRVTAVGPAMTAPALAGPGTGSRGRGSYSPERVRCARVPAILTTTTSKGERTLEGPQ